MISINDIKTSDPLSKQSDHGLDTMQGQTPFDPPEARQAEKKQQLPEENLPEIIRQLVEEHRFALSNIDLFEEALIAFRNATYQHTEQTNNVFSHFFKYFDQHLLAHNEKEDKVLFPLLEEKLLESGEHSTAEIPSTAIDVMQDDHVRFIQLGALTFNLLGIATRISDENSRIFVCENAYHTGRELIELLKLHIYREDHTLFPLACQLISSQEFSAMEPKCRRFQTDNN